MVSAGGNTKAFQGFSSMRFSVRWAGMEANDHGIFSCHGVLLWRRWVYLGMDMPELLLNGIEDYGLSIIGMALKNSLDALQMVYRRIDLCPLCSLSMAG